MWRLPEFISEEDLLDKPMILLLVLASVLQSSVTYSPGDSLCLANQDVVTLVAHGLPETMVLRAIEKTKNKFDVSPASLRDLRKAGISDALIAAMCSTQLTKSRQLDRLQSSTAPLRARTIGFASIIPHKFR
jgi:hypothetical protein